MKKIVFLMLAAVVVMMVGCKKTDEGDGPSGGNGTDTAAVVKHNKTLVFDDSGASIHLDTINYYLAQPDVDSVFMQAVTEDLLTNYTPSQTHSAIMFMQERCDISPRVRGKGGLLLNSQTDTADLNMALRQGFDARINGRIN